MNIDYDILKAKAGNGDVAAKSILRIFETALQGAGVEPAKQERFARLLINNAMAGTRKTMRQFCQETGCDKRTVKKVHSLLGEYAGLLSGKPGSENITDPTLGSSGMWRTDRGPKENRT